MPQKSKKLVWAPLSSADFAKKTDLAITTSLAQVSKSDKVKLQDHQKIVRSYLNPETPYRGILLYHGLGSGKTCSAIAISEGHKQTSKTVVFLPGQSLEDNFIHELEKCGSVEYATSHKNWVFKEFTDENEQMLEKEGIPKNTLLNLNGGWVVENGRGNFSKLKKSQQHEIKQQIKDKIEERYSIVRYNGVSREKLETYTREKFLDNKLVIIDEAHNVISMMTNYVDNPNDSSNHMRGRLLYNLFMSAKNTKFIFLTGTPVMNYPKELAVTFNVLRGPMDVFKFTIKGASDSNKLKNIIEAFPYVDFLRVSYNNQVEMTQTVFGFAIRNGEIFKDEFAPKNHKEWLDKFYTFVNSKGLSINNDEQSVETFNCFPTDEKFEDAFLKTDLTDIQNDDVFKRRIVGLVSYYGDKTDNPGILNDDGTMVYNKPNFPTMIVHPTEKISMSMTQYIQYEKERLHEIRSDAKKAMRKPRFGDEGKDTSTYRARSLALCTFTFPSSITPCEKITAENREKVMNDLHSQFVVYIGTLSEENRKSLKELSPKYWLIKERIEKLDATSVIYSRLKNREGLLSMFAILESCGWKQLSISQNKKTKKWTVEHGGDKTYVLYGDKDDEHRELLRRIFNSDMSDIPQELLEALPAPNNFNGEIIKSFFITASGAEGITLKNVRQLHVIEHHWSPVRIDQVIGRVNRLHSHTALPEEKRIVHVYKYETTFGDKLVKKLENDANHKDKFSMIVAKDGTVTSDQHQIAVSERKRLINTKMLSCLRTASIDCALHKIAGCYQIDNNSYEPSFENHMKSSGVNQAPMIQLVNFEVPAKTWIPKRFHGKIMLIDEKTGQLYDKEEVKLGRPVVKATYNKENKKFVLNRKKKD